MRRITIYIIVILALAAGACEKKIDPIDTYTEDERARDILYSIMNEWYFWYKKMPVVELKDFEDPYTLVDALRYDSLDRWSYVTDYESFMDYYAGSFAGHGIRVGLDDDDKARIVMIYDNSPLYTDSVRRGWIVNSVNGIDIAALLVAGDYEAYDAAFGPRQANITNTFVFTRPNGTTKQVTSTKAEFTVNSVLKYDTLHLSSGITGYLAFESFIEPSFDELEEAFGYFMVHDVKDMILDLRYNSGGMVDVALELASHIAGSPRAGQVFARQVHNDKKTQENVTEYFKSTGYSLNVNRLAVITTRETASASELVINGLMPHIDVKCFGDTTSGKPVGYYGFTEATRKYVFLPVAFQYLNSLNYGDFYKGFAPQQYVPDDITLDFGDRNELMLKAAIEYMETGGTKGSYQYRPQRMAPWKPEWQNNMFLGPLKTIKN
jgi:hypothetical protein